MKKSLNNHIKSAFNQKQSQLLPHQKYLQETSSSGCANRTINSAISTHKKQNLNNNCTKEKQMLSTNRSVTSFNATTKLGPQKVPTKASNTATNKPNKSSSSINCTYKETMEKRKRKKLPSKSEIQKEKLNSDRCPSEADILNAIQNFYDKLSSLSLDKLIISQDRHFEWVNEQFLTLHKLSKHLQKMAISVSQRQFYDGKLHSTGLILKNIQQNLDTLSKMNLLKNYQSSSEGTSRQSRQGQTLRTLGQEEPYQQHRVKEQENSGFQRHKKVFVESEEQDSNSEVNFQYFNPQSKTLNNHQAFHFDSESDKPLSSLQQSAHQTLTSEQKENDFRKSNTHYSGSRRTSSKFKNNIYEKSNFDINEENLKPQGVSKMILESNYTQKLNDQLELQKKCEDLFGQYSQINQSANSQSKTLNRKMSTHEMMLQTQQNEETEDQEQTLNTNQTLKLQSNRTSKGYSNNQASILKEQSSQDKETSSPTSPEAVQKLIQNLIKGHQKQTKNIKFQHKRIQKQLLETIYELKTELKQKNESIKQLMIEAQEINDHRQILQIQKHKLECSLESSKQSENSLNEGLVKQENELKLSKAREQQLRETIRLERQRTKSAELSVEAVERSSEDYQLKIQQLQKQLQKQISQKEAQCENLKAVQGSWQKQKQKGQLYQQKYFRLAADFDQFKKRATQEQSYWSKICICCKKAISEEQKRAIQGESHKIKKSEELRQIIKFHKQKLMSVGQNGQSNQ